MLNETCDGRCNTTANYFLLMELSASTHNYSTRANCYTMKWLLVNEHVIRSYQIMLSDQHLAFHLQCPVRKKGLRQNKRLFRIFQREAGDVLRRTRPGTLRKEDIQVTTHRKRAVKSSSTGPGLSGFQFKHHIYKKNICLYFNLISPTHRSKSKASY